MEGASAQLVYETFGKMRLYSQETLYRAWFLDRFVVSIFLLLSKRHCQNSL